VILPKDGQSLTNVLCMVLKGLRHSCVGIHFPRAGCLGDPSGTAILGYSAPGRVGGGDGVSEVKAAFGAILAAVTRRVHD